MIIIYKTIFNVWMNKLMIHKSDSCDKALDCLFLHFWLKMFILFVAIIQRATILKINKCYMGLFLPNFFLYSSHLNFFFFRDPVENSPRGFPPFCMTNKRYFFCQIKALFWASKRKLLKEHFCKDKKDKSIEIGSPFS